MTPLLAVTVKLKLPAVVGEPESSPSLLRWRPPGRFPPVTLNCGPGRLGRGLEGVGVFVADHAPGQLGRRDLRLALPEWELSPQQTDSPVVRTAQVWAPPAETETNSPSGISSSWPEESSPQQARVPSVRIAQVWVAPAETETNSPSGIPSSWPEESSPQQVRVPSVRIAQEWAPPEVTASYLSQCRCGCQWPHHQYQCDGVARGVADLAGGVVAPAFQRPRRPQRAGVGAAGRDRGERAPLGGGDFVELAGGVVAPAGEGSVGGDRAGVFAARGDRLELAGRDLVGLGRRRRRPSRRGSRRRRSRRCACRRRRPR